MKKSSYLLVLITAIMGLCVCSCSKNNDEEDSPSSIVVKDDGTTSNGSIFSAIDDKNFYLDYVKYTVEEGHLVVSGYDKVGFKGVAKITSRITYKGNTYEVLSIGREAFSRCTNLTAIEIPNIVKSIGIEAFRECTELTSIEIPNSVTSIGSGAFYGCSGLQKVIVADIATWCGIKFGNYNSNPLSVANHLYSDENTEIKDLVIPNSVTSISGNAFSYCTGLTSVTIGNGVTTIGDYAFYGCTGLKSIDIPNSVISIGSSAFYGCNLKIVNRIVNIVQWCKSDPITYQGSNSNPMINATEVHLFSERNTEITDLIIPDGISTIRSEAFKNCVAINSITIPNSVTSIGSSAFYGCTGLTSINIPNSVTIIDDYAFGACTQLCSVHSQILNPFNVSIGKDVFYSNYEKTDTLFVPQNTLEKYLTSTWCSYESENNYEIPYLDITDNNAGEFSIINTSRNFIEIDNGSVDVYKGDVLKIFFNSKYKSNFNTNYTVTVGNEKYTIENNEFVVNKGDETYTFTLNANFDSVNTHLSASKIIEVRQKFKVVVPYVLYITEDLKDLIKVNVDFTNEEGKTYPMVDLPSYTFEEHKNVYTYEDGGITYYTFNQPEAVSYNIHAGPLTAKTVPMLILNIPYYRFNIDTEIILTYQQKADVVETREYNIGRRFERKKASVVSPTEGATDKDWRYTVPMFTGEQMTGKQAKSYVDKMVKEKDIIKLHIDADGNVTERK